MTGLLTNQRRNSLTPWFRRGPLSMFREMEDYLDRFWDYDGEAPGVRMLAPPVDLSETEKSICLRMDLPGVSPKEIDVQVNGNQLTISGERREEREEKGETFHRVERRAGRFSRSIILPCDVQNEKVDAKYQDGVLRISLPKTTEAAAKHIEVKG